MTCAVLDLRTDAVAIDLTFNTLLNQSAISGDPAAERYWFGPMCVALTRRCWCDRETFPAIGPRARRYASFSARDLDTSLGGVEADPMAASFRECFAGFESPTCEEGMSH